MAGSLASEYDIVHFTVVDSTCVTVVGEYHDSVQSQQLIQRVLADSDPIGICVELCPERYNPKPSHGPLLYRERDTAYTRGISTVETFAQKHEVPVYLIDEWYRVIRAHETPADLSPPRPAPDGDIDTEALREFRGQVQQDYPTYFREMLQRREEVMAAHLRAVVRETSGPIVAVVGAAHAEPVASLLASVEPVSLGARRRVVPK